jgi:hypothetical protein
MKNDKEADIMDKAIALYNTLARNDSSGCELKLTEGYHMTVTISRTVEFPELEPLKEVTNEE